MNGRSFYFLKYWCIFIPQIWCPIEDKCSGNAENNPKSLPLYYFNERKYFHRFYSKSRLWFLQSETCSNFFHSKKQKKILKQYGNKEPLLRNSSWIAMCYNGLPRLLFGVAIYFTFISTWKKKNLSLLLLNELKVKNEKLRK